MGFFIFTLSFIIAERFFYVYFPLVLGHNTKLTKSMATLWYSQENYVLILALISLVSLFAVKIHVKHNFNVPLCIIPRYPIRHILFGFGDDTVLLSTQAMFR